MKELLSSKLKIVEQLLLENINALNSPLSTLIHAQLPQCYPLVRAAIVFITSDHIHNIEQEQSAEEYSPYIYLATALEALHLALKIHELLINESSNISNKSQPSKTLIGGTILAGDYCFSCAARLSTKTNHPLVVEIFAHTLKKISEEHLVHLSDPDRKSALYDINKELFYTGIIASAALSEQSLESRHTSAVQLSQQLADLLQALEIEEEYAIDLKMAGLSDYEEERWSDFVAWLDQEKSACA